MRWRKARGDDAAEPGSPDGTVAAPEEAVEEAGRPAAAAGVEADETPAEPALELSGDDQTESPDEGVEPEPEPATQEAAAEEQAEDFEDEAVPAEASTGSAGGGRFARVAGFAVLPVLALVLASAVGYLKWQAADVHDVAAARVESVRAASDSTIAMLSYRPDTVQTDLESARYRLTGRFLKDYTSLIHDVVIPGAKDKQISAVATVPAAASLSATRDHATVLVYVDQTIIVGDKAPAPASSSVEVTLDKVRGHWLISRFAPV